MADIPFPDFKSQFALMNSSCAEEWAPEENMSLVDGYFMHDAIYPGHMNDRLGDTISAPIGVFIESVLDRVREKIGHIESGREEPDLRVIDYGSGTGLAIIELLKAMQQSGLSERIIENNINVEFYAIDLPTNWFAVGRRLLKDLGCVRFYTIFDPDSRSFITVDEIFPEGSIDIIMSSMVFHLIPKNAFSSLFEAFSSILCAHGSLLWNSPDLVPDSNKCFKMHTPYRMLREKINSLILDDAELQKLLSINLTSPKYMVDYIRSNLPDYVRSFNKKSLEGLNQAADRYIKPDSQVPTVEELHSLQLKEFAGQFSCQSFDIDDQHIYPPILVPSNENYCNQLPAGVLRTMLIHVILNDVVIPEIKKTQESGVMSIGWVFGSYQKN